MSIHAETEKEGIRLKYAWMEKHCLSKPGAVKIYKAEWEATLYSVAGKMFVMHGGDKKGKEIITVKLVPEKGRFLRSQHREILPGYYMNKEHWNSVYTEGEIPDHLLKEMIDESYGLVFRSLTKKVQAEIEAGA